MHAKHSAGFLKKETLFKVLRADTLHFGHLALLVIGLVGWGCLRPTDLIPKVLVSLSTSLCTRVSEHESRVLACYYTHVNKLLSTNFCKQTLINKLFYLYRSPVVIHLIKLTILSPLRLVLQEKEGIWC